MKSSVVLKLFTRIVILQNIIYRKTKRKAKSQSRHRRRTNLLGHDTYFKVIKIAKSITILSIRKSKHNDVLKSREDILTFA